MDKKFSKTILLCLPKSDCLLLVKLEASPFDINLIVTYTPTAETHKSVLKMFYESLDHRYKSCKSFPPRCDSRYYTNILLLTAHTKFLRNNVMFSL